jgi:hypothetical protein
MFAGLLFSGCISSGVIPIGSNVLTPLPASISVLVYSSENDITTRFKVVGIISYTNPGKYRILSLSDVVPDLKELARQAGANAIIIDETRTVKSGIISTGIGVRARAILVER